MEKNYNNIERTLKPTLRETLFPFVGFSSYVYRANNEIKKISNQVSKEEMQEMENIYTKNALLKLGLIHSGISATIFLTAGYALFR